MSLDNLLGTSLEKIEPDSASITKLLIAAARNIKDARVEAVSNENRFDAAYKAILQLASSSAGHWLPHPDQQTWAPHYHDSAITQNHGA
tara:strand:+ start:446164 stop:446430 length:267 start_codon:yes stop_codon:yes gene_type:complete